MLKPKVLGKVLSQANTEGCLYTVLLGIDGSLVAWAGEEESISGAENDPKITSAIAFHIWQAYLTNGSPSLSLDVPEFVLLECENGKVVITKVGKLLLCLYTNSTAQFGSVKAKAAAISEKLQECLAGEF
eukprot:CFRG5075T1